jgi:DNA-binding CsgD family transcriptional regulator
LAIALRRLGLLRPDADGLEYLQQSRRLLDGSGRPLERARTLLALGRFHRLRRHFPQARGFLTEARALALASGAHGVLHTIDDELVMARGRPRLYRDTGGTPLTAGEDRVARLAMTGQTNDQIARELFVARRTVEVHLTSVYRKLNIRGRAELPAALEALSEQPGRRRDRPR